MHVARLVIVLVRAGRETMNLTLQPGATATFRYRVVVLEEKAPADRIEREFTAFARSLSE